MGRDGKGRDGVGRDRELFLPLCTKHSLLLKGTAGSSFPAVISSLQASPALSVKAI